MASKGLSISSKKRVHVTLYKNAVYVHFNDVQRDKSVTFTKDEFQTMLSKIDKIKGFMKALEKKKKTGGKKQAKSAAKSSSESENSDTDMSD